MEVNSNLQNEDLCLQKHQNTLLERVGILLATVRCIRYTAGVHCFLAHLLWYAPASIIEQTQRLYLTDWQWSLQTKIINVGHNRSALCLAVLCKTDAKQGVLPATYC